MQLQDSRKFLKELILLETSMKYGNYKYLKSFKLKIKVRKLYVRLCTSFISDFTFRYINWNVLFSKLQSSILFHYYFKLLNLFPVLSMFVWSNLNYTIRFLNDHIKCITIVHQFLCRSYTFCIFEIAWYPVMMLNSEVIITVFK